MAEIFLWKAVDERGLSLCTVPLFQKPDESDEDFRTRARVETVRQLDRPGRRQYLQRWVEGGRRLVARL